MTEALMDVLRSVFIWRSYCCLHAHGSPK